MKISLFLAFAISFTSIAAQEIVVRSSLGEMHVIDIRTSESFLGTIELLQSSMGAGGDFFIDFMTRSVEKPISKNESTPFKDFKASLTKEEKKDIQYLVNTLGMNSLVSITNNKSSLKRAGKRIDHIHPLRFLLYIFSDEEMKASMKAMEGRSWVWSEFIDNLVNSFNIEVDRDNMKPEFLREFCKKVNIDMNLIQSAVEQRRWESFVSICIANVPRYTQTDRYNDL